MASDAREITEARTRYAEEVASVVAPRGAGSKRRGHSGQGSPNQAGAEIAGETDGSRTLRGREVDSNHQYRVTRLRFREGVISGGLVWAAERAVPRPHKQKALMPPSGT